jgi:hypothetical protein
MVGTRTSPKLWYAKKIGWTYLSLLITRFCIHILFRLLGDLWRSRRKLLTPAFHFSILNSFVDVFNEQSRILCGIIDDICQSFPDGKGLIDVFPLITRCSLDIICGNISFSRLHEQRQFFLSQFIL